MIDKTLNCLVYVIGIIAVVICVWAIYMTITEGDRPAQYYCERVTARSLTYKQLKECEEYFDNKTE